MELCVSEWLVCARINEWGSSIDGGGKGVREEWVGKGGGTKRGEEGEEGKEVTGLAERKKGRR